MGTIDHSQCDNEPIHIPGSIQPHGLLVVLHGPTLRIVQASDNTLAHLGVAATHLIGRDLGEALGSGLVDATRSALERHAEAPSLAAELRWQQATGTAPWTGFVHTSSGLAILELEPELPQSAFLSDRLDLVVRASESMRAESDVLAKALAAAGWVRRLTGYDRVMVYRFHEDWHGEVIAEARLPELTPYLGLHYPATDIPVQARRRYLISPTRVIVDIGYTPSPLVPAVNPVTMQSLDLSRSLLRRVSPVHITYLRNRGVAATMTVSLIDRGRLWGLISCHHGRPHRVSASARAISDWIARDLASQVAVAEDAASQRHAAQLERSRTSLIDALRRGTRLSDIVSGPMGHDLLSAVGADGVALVQGADVVTLGATPPASRIVDIADRVSAHAAAASTQLFLSDALSTHFPDAADLADTAAGLVMFPLDVPSTVRLLWFRGERVRTVRWGGDPDNAIDVGPGAIVSPRRSFAEWVQTVRFRSAPWRPEEQDSARAFGVVIDIELRRQADEARRDSERLLTGVLDSLSARVAVVDGAGVITAVNEPWRAFARANSGGAGCEVGANYLDACRVVAGTSNEPGAKDALDGICGVLAGASGYFEMEYPCDSPGAPRWYVMRAFRLSGQVPGAIIAHENITARKEADRAKCESEGAVLESEARFQNLADAAPVLIWMSGTDKLCFYFNERWLTFTGRTLAQESGHGWTQGVHPDDYERCLAVYVSSFDARRPFSMEYRLRRADGAWCWLLDNGVPRFTPDGTFAGYIGSCVDITRIKDVEERLIGREETLRAIYMGSPVGIVRTDLERRMLDANPAFLRLTGYPLEELIGMPISALAHPDSALAELAAFNDLRSGSDTVVRLEARWVRKGGSSMWVSLTVQPSSTDPARPRFFFGIVEDVTDRRQIQDELRRVAREQQIILESMNVGVLLTIDGRNAWCNRTVERLFGYSRQELIDQSPRILFGSDDHFSAAERVMVGRLAHGHGVDTEAELRRKDGTPVWIAASGRLVEPGRLSKGVLWVLSDRTHERQAESALRQSESRFRQLFEAHTAIMLLIDRSDGAIVDANPAAATFYGYDRATLRQMTLRDVSAQSPEDFTQSFQRVVVGSDGPVVVQDRLSSGEIRTVEVSAAPIETDGRQLHFAIIKDVSVRELAQTALLRERQRYRTLLAIAQDGIHVLDAYGYLIEANEAFLRMLGYPPGEVPRLHVSDWDARIAAETLVPAVQSLIATAGLFETRHRRRDGSVFDVEVHAGGIELEGQRYLLASSRDITVRKEYEHQLRLKATEVEELNHSLEQRVNTTVGELRVKDQLLITQSRQAAMGEMIGNIAHQWRQPLNALGLVLANLKDDVQSGGQAEAAVEHAIVDARLLIQKMSTTINDFQNFFRPEKTKTGFSLLAQVRETIRLIEPSFRSAGVSIEALASAEPISLGFSNEYSQVLLVLLSNARHAIRDANLDQGRIDIWVGVRDGLGCVTVRDNGGGIPESVTTRLFEPYFSTKEGGTGIGLYMSRQIIERNMDGRIEARNVDGGAEFAVYVPLAPDPSRAPDLA